MLTELKWELSFKTYIKLNINRQMDCNNNIRLRVRSKKACKEH